MVSAYFGEFIGTLILILMGNGVVAGGLLQGSKAENQGWLVIVFAWGLSVTLAIYAVGKISGAHINPAVTISLASVNKFDWSMVPGYICAQLSGAFVGSILVWIHYHPHWHKTKDAQKILATFCTSPAIYAPANNLVSEIIGTFILVFAIFFIGANEFTQGLNPLVIGILIMAIGLSLGGTTGFAINPARDLGPRLAHFLLPIPGKGPSEWHYSWIPVVGPLVGGVTGALCYQAVFMGVMSLLFWFMLLISMSLILLSMWQSEVSYSE